MSGLLEEVCSATFEKWVVGIDEDQSDLWEGSEDNFRGHGRRLEGLIRLSEKQLQMKLELCRPRNFDQRQGWSGTCV